MRTKEERESHSFGRSVWTAFLVVVWVGLAILLWWLVIPILIIAGIHFMIVKTSRTPEEVIEDRRKIERATAIRNAEIREYRRAKEEEARKRSEARMDAFNEWWVENDCDDTRKWLVILGSPIFVIMIVLVVLKSF